MSKGEYAMIQDKLSRGEALSEKETKDVMSMPNVDGDLGVQVDEAFDESEDIDSGKKEVVAAEKKEVVAAEKKEKETVDIAAETIAKMEVEDKKPEREKDWTKFSWHDRDMFNAMKYERRRAQKAIEERDKAVKIIAQKEAAQSVKDEKVDEEEDLFAGKKDDDLIEVADIKKILKKQGLAKEQKTPEETKQVDKVFYARWMKSCEAITRKEHDDFDLVDECVNEIVLEHPEYQEQCLEAIKSGENPAELMYQLVKNDPQFEDVARLARARLKAKGMAKDEKKAADKQPTEEEKKRLAEAEEKERKIKENQEKGKTSGANTGGGDDDGEGVSLVDIANMPDDEYRRLPKKTRDAYFKKFAK